MKISELMIGDFVYGCGRVERVTGIGFSEPYLIETLFVGAFCHRKETDVTPIPLSDDILIKNGFRRNGNLFELSNNDFCIQHDYKKFYAYNYWEDIVRKNYITELDSVHKLQNLLRILGFNDILENFKI